jgi:hypothetical protein
MKVFKGVQLPVDQAGVLARHSNWQQQMPA